MSQDLLNPERALIFRIVHRENLNHILSQGCLCRNAAVVAAYAEIGNQDLIARRTARLVPCPPGGTLSDYVPFYFTPYSPMLYNIKTGYNGIEKKPLSDIVILVSSLHKLKELKIPFVFSDRHAYLKTALFSDDLADLDRIIWPVLQERNFKKDDLERFEKYQAEALVFRHLPLSALIGIACYDEAMRTALQTEANLAGLNLKVAARPQWYP